MARVSLKNMNKTFPNDLAVVKDFSLDIEAGEFIVFVGPSGSGKSMTLRMIAGLEEVTSGEIWIDNKLVNDVETKDRDIAMIFQNYVLYPQMSVYDNMAFGLKLCKTSNAEIDKLIHETAKLLTIEHLLEHKPNTLSDEQRQLVAMARAVVRKPKVILMDEPLANLDETLRMKMRMELSKLHQKMGTTIIYVTKDLTEALSLGTRIVVMKDGVIQQIGTPTELTENPQNLFVEDFCKSRI